jgi:hypothetical protein
MTAAEFAVLLNSALYLAGCIAAGLATGNRAAWLFAIGDAGLLYLGYLAQTAGPLPKFAGVLWLVATILAGALAGVSLLIGALLGK